MTVQEMSGRDRARGPQPTSVGTVLRWVVAALMLGSGAIHFAMMGEHAGVSWTHGLFFATAGWLQLALAAMIGFRPTQAGDHGRHRASTSRLLTVWVLTRTVGIAIGGDGTPEAWGKVDGLCAVFEGLAVLASVGLLSKSFSRRPLERGRRLRRRRRDRRRSSRCSPASSSAPRRRQGRSATASAPTVTTTVPAAKPPPVAHTHAAPVRVRRSRRHRQRLHRHRRAHRRLAVRALRAHRRRRARSGKDAEGHAHRGPFKQEPADPGRGDRSSQAEQDQARGVALKYPTVAAAEAAGYQQVDARTCRASARTTRTPALVGAVRPGRPVRAPLRRHERRTPRSSGSATWCSTSAARPRASPGRTTAGTSTTSTAGSA